MPIDPSTAFVSYSREDSDFVRRLASDLKAKGAKVWMDKLDIRPGQRWEIEVEKALNDCSRMLVILSPAAVASPNMLAEAAFAIDEGKEVIPVLYRDCKIPFRLRPFQYSDFRDDYSVGLTELLAALGVEQLAASELQEQPEIQVPVEVSPLREPKREEAQQPLQEARHAAVEPSGPPPDRQQTVVEKIQAAKVATATGLFAKFSPRSFKVSAVALGVLLLALFLYSGSRPKWESQTSGTGIEESLRSVAFVSPQSGWAVGDRGTILHTADGGQSWQAQSSGTQDNLHSVAFVSPQAGWAVGEGGTILHTGDGGQSWQAQGPGSHQWLESVAFVSPQAGWAVGLGGAILHYGK